MADRQNYIVRNGVAQPYPIPEAPRPTISEMRQLLRGYDQLGILLPNAAILTNENSKVDILRCGTLYADNIAGIVAETWTNPDPVTVTIGGVTEGDTLTGLSAIDILELMLYPYKVVSLTSFDIGFGGTTVYEIGSTIGSSVSLPTWTIVNIENAVTGGVGITFTSPSTSGTLLSGANPDGSGASFVSHNTANYSSNTVGSSLVFTISVDQQEEANATRSQTFFWRSKIYVGKNANSSYTSITNFNQLSNGSNDFIYSNSSPAKSGLALTAGSGYVYIFVHTSLNPLTSVSIGSTDQTSAFPLVSSSHSVSNGFNTSTYRVYRSSNLLNGDFVLNIT